MRAEHFVQLVDDIETEILAGADRLAILGLTRVTTALLARLAQHGLISAVSGVYVDGHLPTTNPFAVNVRSMAALAGSQIDLVAVAADTEKEDLLSAALPHLNGAPRVIVAGYGHLAFRDRLFDEEVANLLVPSLANGYPHSLIHLYQCLVNASRLELQGCVAEFGMFKGGTTMFLSRIIERLGESWPVVGFDTFEGFPPRTSPLDMYDHPDCVFTDLDAVKRYLEPRAVEVVTGDIVMTASRLQREDVVLSFIDTDNFSSAQAALEVVRERTVVGGAIVFDHFTGVDRFRYTLGERMAGRALLDDSRYLHLHGTGVFYRQAL